MRRISLAAALALGLAAALVEAGANYSAEARGAGTLTGERADFERATPSARAPYSFSLSAALPLDAANMRCGDDARAAPASQRADGQFNINCVADSTASAAGAWPRAQLLSSPGDSRYDRAVRF